MKISIIAEGSTKWEGFIGKWGVSFLIGENLLFDTFGRVSFLLKNIKKMGINIHNIKNIVISHEHWDHINGLWHLLTVNPGTIVYICPSFIQKFKDLVRSYKVSCHEIQKLTKIYEDIYVTGEIGGEYHGKYMPEQALIIKTQNGLVVITGCAHPGIIKILEEVKRNFDESIYMVMGGFHLMNKEEEAVTSIIEKFRQMNIEKVAPMHCTGQKAVELFAKEYGNNFIEAKAGMVIEV